MGVSADPIPVSVPPRAAAPPRISTAGRAKRVSADVGGCASATSLAGTADPDPPDPGCDPDPR